MQNNAWTQDWRAGTKERTKEIKKKKRKNILTISFDTFREKNLLFSVQIIFPSFRRIRSLHDEPLTVRSPIRKPDETPGTNNVKLFCAVGSSVTTKKSPNVYKSCPKMISLENLKFLTPFNNCLRMWEIWANWLLPKGLKNCPKSNKSPNLVTLSATTASKALAISSTLGSIPSDVKSFYFEKVVPIIKR